MGQTPSAQDSGFRVHKPRPGRIPRAALREHVLREGSALLGEAGVTASLYHVNMEELIRRVGVPRSSVFAAFGGKEGLITELMVKLLEPESDGPLGFSAVTAAAAREVLARHEHRLRRADGTRDLAGEHAVLREAVRVVLAFNTEEFETSTEWHTFMALSASVDSLPPARRERVIEALRESEQHFIEGLAAFYAETLGELGRRMRAGLDWRHLVTAGSGMVEGIVSRRRFGAPVANEKLQLPGIDGEPVEWTLVAVAYLAMLENLTEPIPL